MRNQICRSLATLILAGVSLQPAGAAEWAINPSIAARTGYNDNIRLTTEDQLSSSELSLDPRIVFSYETPISEISGTFNARVRRYPDESDFDDEIAQLNLASLYRMQKSQIGLDIDLTKDTTLDSQLEETGLVFDRVNRIRVAASPNWSYFFSARNSVRMGYRYTDLTYDNNAGSGFVDSQTSSGWISFSRVLNDRATGSITAGHSYTENENDVDSLYSYIQAGASYRFSESLSGSLFAGGRRAETRFTTNTLIPIVVGNTVIGFVAAPVDSENTDNGYVLNAQVSKNFLRGSTSLSASRDISTSISGYLIQVSQINWDNSYNFSETLKANLKVQLYNSETSNPATQNIKREYVRVTPAVHWNFDRFWRLSASYQYQLQKFDTSGEDDAEQNAAYLTVSYDWPRIARSR